MAVMEKYELDALVATDPKNVYYLSDYDETHSFLFEPYGVSAALLPLSENVPATLLVTEVDVPYLAEHPTWMPEVRMIGGFGSHMSADRRFSDRERAVRDLWLAVREKGTVSYNRHEVIAEVIRTAGLERARVGFDDVRAMLAVQGYGAVEHTAVEATNIFREIRMVKTPTEVQILREAAAINEACLKAAANLLTEGTVMRELKRCWYSAMALQGAVGHEFYASGFDRPWFIGPDNYQLRRGDHILLDSAGTYKHYWADVGRIGCVGEPDKRVLELQDVLLEVYRECLPLVKPGVSADAIKNAAIERAAKHGLADGWMPFMHVIGLELYEMPQPYGEILRADFTLEQGMVVNFEVCQYVEFPWGVMQLEDTVLVTEGQAQRIGSLPHELLQVE